MSTFKYNYYYEKCLTVKVYMEESDLGEMKEIFFFNILTTRQWFRMVSSLIDNCNRHHSGHNGDVK